MASNPVTFTVTTVPAITAWSPTSGAAGVQIAISGSGFRTARGTGAVAGQHLWHGGKLERTTRVVATVAANSTSGSARVQQGGAWSDAVAFNVSTGDHFQRHAFQRRPGTSVTIAGSGFGAAQPAASVAGHGQWRGAKLERYPVVASVASGIGFRQRPGLAGRRLEQCGSI